MRHLENLRPLLGVMAKDLPRYVRALAAPGEGYAALCNRNERLESGPDGRGYRCLWQWTSDLHAPKHLPILGGALMRRALRDHPMRTAPRPSAAQPPRLSFIVGHRGLERLGHLRATLETIAGQSEAAIECIVVEQDTQPLLRERLPAWVRYVHTPPPRPDLAYCRSWAFNVGARHARGDVLVLHDNDMLVPQDYAMHVLRLADQGFEVVNLKRFVFYLTQSHTEKHLRGEAGLTAQAPLAVMQNAEGGGSLAITRAAFDGIGGFDEAFVGWGGEDVEFWERAASRRVWPYAFLPLVHLWHGPQPDKMARQNETLALYHSRTQTPIAQRIAALRSLPSGNVAGPCT
jgi:GT2 family glycosyltransferase